jgi:hypothetical protein
VYWSERDGQSELVEIAYLRKQSFNAGSKGRTIEWSGSDNLHELQRYTTMRGRRYNNEPIQDVVRDLVELVPDFAVEFGDTVGGRTTQRFDGISVSEALGRIAETHGLHWRVVPGEDAVLFSELGEELPLRITNILTPERRLGAEIKTAVIEHLNLIRDGFEVVNWIEPVSGPADGALTLRYSTRSSPYTIEQAVNQQGRTIYILQDAASQTAYGVEQQIVSPDYLIIAAQESSQRLINASNVLYDWAATHLDRNKEPKQAYSVTGVKVALDVLPGDKVHVHYEGVVYQVTLAGDLVPAREAEIDEYLWVVKLTERYNLEGKKFDFEVSTVDVLPVDAATLISRSIVRQEADKVAVKLNVASQSASTTASLDVAVTADLGFEVSDEAILVTAAKVTLERDNTTEPEYVTLEMDGEVVPGGPWLWGPDAGTEAVVDITDLLNVGAQVLAGTHTLTVAAERNLPADLSVKVVVYEVVAGLADSFSE